MQKLVTSVLLLLCLCTFSYAAEPIPVCRDDPSETIAPSVIGIERIFDKDEIYFDKKVWSWIEGSRGTAWFVDSRTVATIAHVATGLKLSNQWKEVSLFWSEKKDQKWSESLKVRARLKDIVVGVATLEPVMTLELEIPVAFAKPVTIRPSPLRRNEAVIGIAYTAEVLRFVQGRLALPDPSQDDSSSSNPPPAFLPFEMVDIEKKNGIGDRYALDHGSSGAPIFDCNGEVVAVVQNFMTKEMAFLGKTILHTTPWGHPNVAGVSALPLLDKQK